ncbi:hypothetical protein CGCF415_v007956 [Colletotrichum fructicola]|nr:hypothetical protein CGCF415_v007956 [Colletotrichum fructicola]
MAEPVGITGTAAGLISLGLQLYSEISNYLDAVKGRQQDLDFARHQCASLKRRIDAIDAAITSPGFLPMVSRDALDSSVQGCQRELGALNELVLRLQGPSSPVSTVSAKLREKDEAAGDVQTALKERFISVPLSLRVFEADNEDTASYVWGLGFRDLGVDLATGFYEL